MKSCCFCAYNYTVIERQTFLCAGVYPTILKSVYLSIISVQLLSNNTKLIIYNLTSFKSVW